MVVKQHYDILTRGGEYMSLLGKDGWMLMAVLCLGWLL